MVGWIGRVLNSGVDSGFGRFHVLFRGMLVWEPFGDTYWQEGQAQSIQSTRKAIGGSFRGEHRVWSLRQRKKLQWFPRMGVVRLGMGARASTITQDFMNTLENQRG
ncbi:hypothetical protein N7468_002650 [Penicillium chermesinum]|uniref:Uncharacterized protein n=1 Tax=Penicillium chermesinum TaxID=63820 RepID=A0A9W9PKC7_9EURO|nr:uncharacterized protein N7468_002650 [Penicillium chermesinum]KAJ5247667.1 hypothetical protein N7468_002650 [Penicillium chermesinum]